MGGVAGWRRQWTAGRRDTQHLHPQTSQTVDGWSPAISLPLVMKVIGRPLPTHYAIVGAGERAASATTTSTTLRREAAAPQTQHRAAPAPWGYHGTHGERHRSPANVGHGGPERQRHRVGGAGVAGCSSWWTAPTHPGEHLVLRRVVEHHPGRAPTLTAGLDAAGNKTTSAPVTSKSIMAPTVSVTAPPANVGHGGPERRHRQCGRSGFSSWWRQGAGAEDTTPRPGRVVEHHPGPNGTHR